MPGVLSNRSRYRPAAAWFSAWWSRVLARISWSKSPPTIGTELIAVTGGTRRSRSGAIRPRRAASCSGRSSTEAGKTSETCFDQLLRRRHADVKGLRERADRGRGLLPERRVRLVADHELVRVAVDRVDVAREPGVRLDGERRLLRAAAVARDDVGEALAVALGRQVARELGDEQAAVREDQDTERAGRLDEARRGDRLPRGGRMAEAVAADGTRVVLLRLRWKLRLLDLDDAGRALVLVLDLH